MEGLLGRVGRHIIMTSYTSERGDLPNDKLVLLKGGDVVQPSSLHHLLLHLDSVNTFSR